MRCLVFGEPASICKRRATRRLAANRGATCVPTRPARAGQLPVFPAACGIGEPGVASLFGNGMAAGYGHAVAVLSGGRP